MDIGGWLRSLGLERHEAAFRENAIDADILRDVTDHDLEKLGRGTSRTSSGKQLLAATRLNFALSWRWPSRLKG
jgi:hypothetical protein